MDTKWKKFRAFLSWTARLSVLGMLFLAFMLLQYQRGSVWNSLSDAIINPPQWETHWLQDNARDIAEDLVENLSIPDISAYGDPYGNYWFDRDYEENNIKYYAYNRVTGKQIGDIGLATTPPSGNYGLSVIVKNGKAVMHVNGVAQNTYINIPYMQTFAGHDENGEYYERVSEQYKLSDFVVCLYVKTPIDQTVNSSLAVRAQMIEDVRLFVYIFAGFCAVLILLALIFFKHKKQADRFIANLTRHIWLEFKLIAAVICVGVIANAIQQQVVESWLAGFLFFVPLYVLWSDLLVNKKQVFTHNSVSTVMKIWHRHLSRKPFQKAMVLDFNALIIAEIVLVFLTALFIIMAAGTSYEVWLSLCLITIPAGLFLAWRFSRRYKRMVADLGGIVDHVAAMNEGKFEKQLEIPEDAVLYPVSQSINSIQGTYASALQKATKSERMKVDLITNVSHDLKTPLTSIISYVELLSQMELPDEAGEHVEILAQKSERLKLLINDLFDLSKSTSGSMEMNMEALDLARLAEQTLCDADDRFKIKLSDRPLWIFADGGKMSRVLYNLLDNAQKYAMDGTRVYVDTYREGTRAVYEIKNVANYEMNFSVDEIAERFVRGDAARSDEGSGLGLSIAQSFTEACGGTFKVSIDGDMFKVRITFAAVEPANM